MAVLVEAISVIMRADAIRDRYPSGWPGFEKNVPNETLCCDNELARVGFMNPNDCESFVDGLGRVGIVYLNDGNSQDIVVADQMQGFTTPCDWAEFGRIEMKPDQPVSAARTNEVGEVRELGVNQVLDPDAIPFVSDEQVLIS